MPNRPAPIFESDIPDDFVIGLKSSENVFLSIKPILDPYTGERNRFGGYVEPVYSNCKFKLGDSKQASKHKSIKEILDLFSDHSVQLKKFLNESNISIDDLVIIKLSYISVNDPKSNICLSELIPMED